MLPDIATSAMDAVWIILAAVSFLGGQVYLFRSLRLLDQLLTHRLGRKSAAACGETTLVYDDHCRYPPGDVVE